jgi:hypothetical protein
MMIANYVIRNFYVDKPADGSPRIINNEEIGK